MELSNINKDNFRFEHLPKYAKYLLEQKLDEYVTVNIRYAREVDLPLLKPLAKLSEQELVSLSVGANKLLLSALENNTISEYIETNLNNWLSNQLGTIKDGKGLIDKNEIVAEDLTLGYYIKRKTFSYFLYGYTQNPSIRQLIVNEVDQYTSYEELASLKVYLGLQKEMIEGKK